MEHARRLRLTLNSTPQRRRYVAPSSLISAFCRVGPPSSARRIGDVAASQTAPSSRSCHRRGVCDALDLTLRDYSVVLRWCACGTVTRSLRSASRGLGVTLRPAARTPLVPRAALLTATLRDPGRACACHLLPHCCVEPKKREYDVGDRSETRHRARIAQRGQLRQLREGLTFQGPRALAALAALASLARSHFLGRGRARLAALASLAPTLREDLTF